MTNIDSYRLIPSKYPPISLYEDVSTLEEFDALYALESMTNPRLQQQAGDVSLLPKEQIPFHCTTHRSYATSTFTHINPNGGRFNDGNFGALYVADSKATACSEVYFHTQKYCQNVDDFKYEAFVFRCLKFDIKYSAILDITNTPKTDPLYSLTDYSASQQLAQSVRKHAYKKGQNQGIKYCSVRYENGLCWVFFTPIVVRKVVQTTHYQMIWDGEQLKTAQVVRNPT